MILKTRSHDDGSVSLEAAILAPALLVLVGVLILAARVSLAHQTVDAAAVHAARAASVSRTPSEADNMARASALTYLNNEGLRCESLDITHTTSGVTKAAGQSSTVSTTITCHVPTADLLIPGLSGTRTITASASSVVDTFREPR